MSDRSEQFGIGRVPADVDQTRETVAELEAVKINPVKSSGMGRCADCGDSTPKVHLIGGLCQDCFDKP